MDRPVMPTWRERGAHPLSVAFRVAASSAPSSAASGLSCSYSSGVTPVPTPRTTRARASVSTSSSRRSDSTRTRPRVVPAQRHHRGRAGSAGGDGQHARPHGDHLRGAAAGDVGHQGTGERRLGRHEGAVGDRQRDGVTHQSRAGGGRGAAGHLTAEGGAGCEHGPRRRLAHEGGDGIGHVFGDGRAVEHDHHAGAGRRQQVSGRGSRAEGVHGRAGLGCEPRRGAEQLLRQRGATRLGQDGDHPGRAPARRPVGVGGQVCRRRRHGRTRARARSRSRRKGAAPAELPYSLFDLRRDRSHHDAPRPLVLHRPRGADHRRAPGFPPGSRAELAGVHPGQARRRHGGAARGVDLAGVAEALGHRQHGGQRDLHLLRPVVVLELQPPERAPVLQLANPAGEGEVEQLGQLGPNLPGLPVDGVAAEQHEVEGARGAQHGGEGARRGQGVGAREGRVAGMQSRVRSPGHRLT